MKMKIQFETSICTTTFPAPFLCLYFSPSSFKQLYIQKSTCIVIDRNKNRKREKRFAIVSSSCGITHSTQKNSILFPRELACYSELGWGKSGRRFPWESYTILPEKSKGRQRSPLMIVFLHTASSLSSSSIIASSSPSDSATFLQDIIFTIERALLLILLFNFEKTLFSFDRKLVFSVNDFLVLLEVHRNAMMENMDATAIMTKKKLTGIEVNQRLWMGRLGLRGLAINNKRIELRNVWTPLRV